MGSLKIGQTKINTLALLKRNAKKVSGLKPASLHRRHFTKKSEAENLIGQSGDLATLREETLKIFDAAYSTALSY